ncbi:MAG: aminopeptidase [Alphaproteobacteria bacterium]|nr:aminopeptidase [Alphaproteobacteria bacterium]
MDNRITQLAENILHNSVKLKKGEIVYLETFGASTKDLLNELIRVTTEIGATPFYFYNDMSFVRNCINGAQDAQIQKYADIHRELMEKADCYVAIRGYDDLFALSDIDDKYQEKYCSIFHKQVHIQTRLPKTRWCVLRYPNNTMAATSRMSLKSFEDFYFDACLLDYAKMGKAMQPLKKLLDETSEVHIIGNDTDLRFSLKGQKAIICDGKMNIPDGEVYTAPVKDSINGYVQFNTDTTHGGTFFSNIRLEFENGKIVNGTSMANNDKFQKILDIDAGSRYIGEFALGVNPYITHPILDILFDEKICGSFHMAVGNSYEDETNNGNVSSIHWDLVKIQTPEQGGGEIWFDNKLIRKDGLFVLPELEGLNPRSLK